MKKIRKTVSAVLCPVLAVVTLAACAGKTDNGTDDLNDVTNEEVTEESEPTETTEEELSGEVVIIPLYDSAYESDILSSSPDSFKSFSTFGTYCPFHSTQETTVNGDTFYQLDTVNSVTLKSAPTDGERSTYEAELYFWHREDTDLLVVTCEGDGIKGGGFVDFVPLFYNQTKGCFAGYSFKDEATFTEYYYSKDVGRFIIVDADPSEYDFYPEEKVEDTLVYFYWMNEDKIRESSAEYLYDFMNYSYLFDALVTGKLLDDHTELLNYEYGTNFVISACPDEGTDEKYDIELYYFSDAQEVLGMIEEGNLGVYYEYEGDGKILWPFVPLLYNETKGCIVGYSAESGDLSDFELSELYFSGASNELVAVPVEDTSVYGFDPQGVEVED